MRGMAITTFIALSTAALVAHANGPEIGFDAGGIVPIGSSVTQLVAEQVEVPIRGGLVHCSYVLKNLTPSDNRITMGFITGHPWPSDWGVNTRRFSRAGIRVHQGKSEIEVRMAPLLKDAWRAYVDAPLDSLPVWEVAFAPGEEVALAITYEVSPSGGCEGRHCGFSMKYHAAAAQLWAGPVDSAIIRFTFSSEDSALFSGNTENYDLFRVEAKPAGYVREGREFRWELREWEPAHDFEVSVESRESK